MSIERIIKNERDRLFILDYECYVIYTGESLEDGKPFIRIGNWMKIPAELIPLTENIIVTDSITGSPAAEQFNIDLRLLKMNRYIGSRDIIKRYLNYQKIFGLDLENASIVEIEKDLPELSKERSLTEKNQFIGVFYSDGNFKTVHNGRTIIDLKDVDSHAVTMAGAWEMLKTETSGSASSQGCGFAVVDNNPVFFSGNRYAAYLFPSDCFRGFQTAGIDPGQITDIIHPSLNMINLCGFIKWRHSVKGRVAIHTDHSDKVDLTQKLFPGCRITCRPFTGINVESIPGLKITGYPSSYNLKAVYSNAPGGEVTAAFVKGRRGVADIAKDNIDLMIICYSAFEDVSMMFKEGRFPVAVIDDGNKNVSKLKGYEHTVLSHGRYDIKKTDDAAGFLSNFMFDESFVSALISSPVEVQHEVSEIIESGDPVRINHLLNLARYALFTTKDRSAFKLHKDIFATAQPAFAGAYKPDDLIRAGYTLVIHGGRAYALLTEARTGLPQITGAIDETSDTEHINNGGLVKFIQRVHRDRERLNELLALLREHAGYPESFEGSLAEIRGSIFDRMKRLTGSSHDIEHVNSESLFHFRTPDCKLMTGGTESSSSLFSSGAASSSSSADAGGYASAETGERKFSPGNRFSGIKNMYSSAPAPVRLGLAALLLIIMAALIYFVSLKFSGDASDADEVTFGGSSAETQAETQPQAGETAVTEQDAAGGNTGYLAVNDSAAVDDIVSDNDIHKYANRIAVMNGYSPIPYNDMHKKNPHWIYPGNVFKLHDGEQVTVIEKDTLWNISKKKLLRMSADFDTAVSALRDGARGNSRAELLRKARSSAFSDQHNKILSGLGKE